MVNIDPKRVRRNGREIWEVHINGGRIGTGLEAVPWAEQVEQLGAGEIVLTSMDADGTKDGYDLEITAAVCREVSIPVVASGGAGCPQHLADAILRGGADAALAASIFHYGEYTVGTPRDHAAAGNPGAVVRIDMANEGRYEGPKTRTSSASSRSTSCSVPVKVQGSDLHLKVGLPPRPRGGDPASAQPRTDRDEEMSRIIYELIDCDPRLKARRREIFERDGGVDFSHKMDVDGTLWRFRVNVLQQMAAWVMVARRVNNKIPDFAGLHLAPVLGELCKFDQGMILLAGVTG